MDPFTYDLMHAIRMIEEYGEDVPYFVDMNWNSVYDPLTQTTNWIPSPKRLDACQCERLLKCPNGTSTLKVQGVSEVYGCYKTDRGALRRKDAIPEFAVNYTWWGNQFQQERVYDEQTGLFKKAPMFLKNSSDFTELGGRSDFAVGTLFMRTFETMVLTLDLRDLVQNLTYNTHYRLAVYVDCKPCRVNYQCDYLVEPPTCDSFAFPSRDDQTDFYDACLQDQTYWKVNCVNATGVRVDQTLCDAITDISDTSDLKIKDELVIDPVTGEDDPTSPYKCIIPYREPDLFKCQQVPFFCDDQVIYREEWGIPMEYCARDGLHHQAGEVARNAS